MTWGRTCTVILAVILTLPGCKVEKEYCETQELWDALVSASPGDTVTVGACRVVGNFGVPAGVILEGVDPVESIIEGESGEAAISVIPGARASRVSNLTVESHGTAGIRVQGAGDIVIEDIILTSAVGLGIAVDGATNLVVANVTMTGPVTRANVDSIVPGATYEDTATHGLVIVDTTSAEIHDINVSGYAMFGALVVNSGVEWTGGEVAENRGTGIMIYSGSATLDGITMCRALQGMSLFPSYAGVFASGATVSTTNLVVCDGDDYGLLHDDVDATHVDISATGNGDAALWAQHCPSFEVSGAMTTISDNKFGGIVLVETQSATISDAVIDASTLATRVFEETGSVDVGDGIQVIRPAGPLSLSNLSMSDNERVGLLLEMSGTGTFADLTIDSITVSGTGAELGAIAQSAVPPDGWDSGVTREGDTEANDSAHVEPLDVAGAAGADIMPSAGSAVDEGVAGIIGDSGIIGDTGIIGHTG